MRILSLNIWGGMLHQPLLAYLAQVDADILCLQEVVRAPSARNPWLTYRDGSVVLQQRARLYEEIAAVLPRHDGSFYPTARGELQDGDATCWQEFGLATFVRKGIPIIGQVLDFIHGQYSHHDFGEHPRSRNAHGIRVFDEQAGGAVTIVQLHGLRDPAGKGDSPERRAQAQALVGLIDRIHMPGDRLLVCGDFNLTPDSETFRMLGERGLADLVTGRGFTDTRTSLYTKESRYADYMLVTPDVLVLDFDVVTEPEISDHRPLLVEIG